MEAGEGEEFRSGVERSQRSVTEAAEHVEPTRKTAPGSLIDVTTAQPSIGAHQDQMRSLPVLTKIKSIESFDQGS